MTAQIPDKIREKVLDACTQLLVCDPREVLAHRHRALGLLQAVALGADVADDKGDFAFNLTENTVSAPTAPTPAPKEGA